MSHASHIWTRQLHRWVSIVFTLTVVANFAVRTQGEPPAWVTYSPLFPLALLLLTGLYLFALPWRQRRRAARRHEAHRQPPLPSGGG